MQIPPISSGRRKRFQEKLLQWYAQHSRELPWRNTRNPYHILVSEMMLQQTQVDRVIPKYHAWLERFPDLETLARAKPKTVIAQWQGLGYNRRALYLHRIARVVTTELDGEFPQTNEELQQLPGIGPYTAGAVMSFAFGAQEPILDTNVKRVLGRVFLGFKKLRKSTEAQLWELSQHVTPDSNATYYFNQAVMDFGALTCTQRKPNCSTCPFQRMCTSYPEIQEAKPAELRLPQVQETLYFGKPRRIWRGKIVKHLHTLDDSGCTFAELGPAIQDDFAKDRLSWLKEVVATLEKDGLVAVSGKKVTLP